MAVTKLANIINPEVMADMVEKKLVDYIKFSPLATVDTTLEGRHGDTITLPSWNYIGDAQVLAEGSSVSIATLTASSTSATIHKVATGVEITDEAVLSGYGDPIGEATDQIALSLAQGIDNETLTVLEGIASAMTYSSTGKDTDILDALELFGEDIDGVKVTVVPATIYTKMRKNTNQWVPASEIAANIALKGVVGEYGGCQVMVSNKLKTSGHSFIVKPGALRIFLKRGVLIETDRDIKKFQTVVTGSTHFVAYLYDASKAIKIG